MTAIQAIDLKTIDGNSTTLGNFDGDVLLVVNVASKCGLTPQYEALEKLYRKYSDKGFQVLGFPANDFAGQEPGTDSEIATFCSTEYGVSFPMFAKIVATGTDKHPLYSELIRVMPKRTNDGSVMRDRLLSHGIEPTKDPEILWNFEKFLIGRDGEVKARFAPDTAPDDPALIAAVEAS